MREPLAAQILNLFPQEILVTTWFLFSRSCHGGTAHPSPKHCRHIPWNYTMELPLDSPHHHLVSPLHVHSPSTDSHLPWEHHKKRLLPWSFSGEDLIQHPTLNSPPQAPSIIVLFSSWQPLTMCFLLHPLINYWEKTHKVFQGSREEKRKHVWQEKKNAILENNRSSCQISPSL